MSLVAFAIPGCTTFQEFSSNFDGELSQYVGLSKEQVVARLGAPEAQLAQGDRTVWSWSSRWQHPRPAGVVLRTTGDAAGEQPTAALVPAGGGSRIIQECELRLTLTPDGGTVERTEWSGTRGGCENYLRALRYVREQPSNVS